MSDDRHEKPVVDHKPAAMPSASDTGNALIRRHNSTDAEGKRGIDKPSLATTVERHRAWLRHVGRRER